MCAYQAWLSKQNQDSVIECLACCHRCKIREGKKGICGVRSNHGGKLYLDVFGRAIASSIDPIEKKPLYHVFPEAPIFSIGTIGCNFRCSFCQNWDISQYSKGATTVELLGEELMPEDVIRFCKEQDISLLAFTYNEPAIFFEYAYDTAVLAQKEGIGVVYVSNGYETPEALEKISPYLLAANIDLKSFRDDFYRKQCGARIEPVKETIQWLWEKGIWVEVTTLVIPHENDSNEELQAIAEFLTNISPKIPWHISRYFPNYKMHHEPTPVATLLQAHAIGKKAGLHYVYVGNVIRQGYEDTFCPACNSVVIARHGYAIHNFMIDSSCPTCGNTISGRFL
jgi:pyruvate formate lyase activating enzyme